MDRYPVLNTRSEPVHFFLGKSPPPDAIYFTLRDAS
jgi:hypothetical protein